VKHDPATPQLDLRAMLAAVANGDLDVETAFARLRPTADLGFAQVVLDRARRCGFPEVVYCPGKTPADTAAIAAAIFERSGRVLLTRAEPAQFAAVRGQLPAAEWHERARCITAARAAPGRHGGVAVVAAGTADLPVAEEAAVTLEFAGNRVERFYDVGVAGLHRLQAAIPTLRRASCAIAVAGMEGALPSVLAGQLSRPVIAVPTSIGYGASFAGLAALLTMLNSCAAGVSVVNIDNGFGAGYLASLINQTPSPTSQES
jgi:NCAIR mutase (PurE)-related protein